MSTDRQDPCPGCSGCKQAANVPSDGALVALAVTCAAVLIAALVFSIWWARRHPEGGHDHEQP